jgi:hypothetical protein
LRGGEPGELGDWDDDDDDDVVIKAGHKRQRVPRTQTETQGPADAHVNS